MAQSRNASPRHVTAWLLLLVASALPASDDSVLVPAPFFLADRFLSHVDYDLRTLSTLDGVSAVLRAHDVMPGAVTLSYSGMVRKPFNERRKTGMSHALDLRTPAGEPRVVVGVSLGADVNALSFEQHTSGFGSNGGQDDIHQFYMKTRDEFTRRLCVRYAGTGNLLVRFGGGFLLAALEGTLSHSSGYSVVKEYLDHDQWRLKVNEYDYDPVIDGLSGGALYTKPLGSRRRILNLVFGTAGRAGSDGQRTYRSEDDTIPVLAARQQVTLVYSDVLSSYRELNAWVGLRPRLPYRHDKSNMILQGHLLHGLSVKELSLRVHLRDDSLKEYSSVPGNALAPGYSSVTAFGTRTQSASVRLEPELFLTRSVAVSLPLSGKVQEFSWRSGPGVSEMVSTSISVDAAVACVAHVYFNVQDNVRMEITASSGELALHNDGVPVPGTEAFDPRCFYHAYNAGVGLGLMAQY